MREVTDILTISPIRFPTLPIDASSLVCTVLVNNLNYVRRADRAVRVVPQGQQNAAHLANIQTGVGQQNPSQALGSARDAPQAIHTGIKTCPEDSASQEEA